MIDYEKLGVFYLGRGYDVEGGSQRPEPFLYDSKDLTTHGLIVGMTGSGKTGLASVLLEEAAIDGVPALVIDPKGDMANLALRFPELRGEDFAPWIEPGEAAREGLSTDALAKETAERWRSGLESSEQGPERIRSLVEAAEVVVYTPGSATGRPIAVLKSFDAPSDAVRGDADARRERVMNQTSGLLGLAGIDADPVTSREHILVASLLDHAWRSGEDSSLPALLAGIQSPPFSRLGALDLESVYPAKERFELATRLNSLLASPAFSAWREGEPLDVSKLLYAEKGKPRLSVLSIAHLTDRERMFFVTLLLNEVVAWMRGLTGTGSLRAILYMDEIFGFFPPVKAPPSKAPMLTLLKQARAFGLGVVLATQNPVDLDYKGLANIGTWFLGRLQTARDRERLLDGLDTISSSRALDRGEAGRLISALDKRVFLVQNVHEDGPALFQTRWALSYLRGPMTLEQIRALEGPPAAEPLEPEGSGPAPSTSAAPIAAVAEAKPRIPSGVPEWFLPPAVEGSGTLYRPGLFATATLHYVHAKSDVDRWETVHLWTSLEPDGRPDWSKAEKVPVPALGREAESGAAFSVLPEAARREMSYERWRKALASHLYRERTLVLLECSEPNSISGPEESEAEFRARLAQLSRERRDRAVEKLRRELAPKLERLQESVRRAEAGLEKETAQYGSSKVRTAIDFGMTLAGALFGRKLGSVANARRASRTARSASRLDKERREVSRAEEELELQQRELAELEEELRARTLAVEERVSAEAFVLAERVVRPRKSEISIEPFGIAWRLAG